MPDIIQRRLAIDLSVDELEKILTEIEQEGLDDEATTTTVQLLRLRAGAGLNGVPGNLVEFQKADRSSEDAILLIGDVPADPNGKISFFTKLLQRGLDIVNYADVFIAGAKVETVVCRKHPEVTPPLPPIPAPQQDAFISQKALDLIVESEGFDQPSRWPGGASGISIGVGYDLGYTTDAEFRGDWSPHLPSAIVNRLAEALGKAGAAAQAMAPRFHDISVPHDAAMAVFKTRTIPHFRALTLAAFPGMEKLPADAQGALISIVYNRGPGMDGDRRREMRAIRDAIANYRTGDDLKPLLEKIADEIEAMKRLWAGAGLDGLLTRRDAEAGLVRGAVV